MINRGDIFWVEPDDSRGMVPDYDHPWMDGLRFLQRAFLDRWRVNPSGLKTRQQVAANQPSC